MSKRPKIRCATCGGIGRHKRECSRLRPMPGHVRTCPDCGGGMQPMRLLGNMGVELLLSYPDETIPPSWVDGSVPTAGYVRAELCDGCGRVRLYALSAAIDEETAPEAHLPIPAAPPRLTAESLPRAVDGPHGTSVPFNGQGE